LLYTAKGTASLLVPVAALLAASPKDWQTVLWLGAGMNVVAAVLALLALRPLRAAHTARVA
jgi:OFA family oxalate/formate antiporter-like MFS transporter